MASTQIVTKVGPVGGVTGAVIRDMNINGITRIVKISVRHASVIDALTVRFLRDGREESTEEWGGQGGKLSEFNLQAAEYITSVKGHIGIYKNYTVLKSLTFVTNLGRFGPYGVEEGMPFELPAISGQIIGFHARYGRGGFLDALGVYIKESTQIVTKVGPVGGVTGAVIRDMNINGITRIVKISVRHASVIDALTVRFLRDGREESTEEWGGQGGKLSELNLQAAEYITSVKGHIGIYNNYTVLKSLTFVTNLGRFGPYGVEEGMPFELPAISGQIIGFHARYGRGGFLDALGVYIKASTQVVTKVGPVTQVVTKVGPVGGVTGAVIRDMNINGITRIVKISVRHASVIDALTVRFLRDGREESTEEWGGQGGKLSEFNLQAAEYITSVKGHIGIYNNYTVLKSLTFVTNLGRFGPYGVEEGMPFELPAISGQIIGFHARYGRGGFLDALGVYIKASTQVVTKVGPVTQVVTKVGPVGGVTGAVIRDMNINGITRIVKISVRHASVIDALTVRFLRDGREESTEEWGGQGGKLSEFNLQAAEYITSVKGHIGIYNNYTVLKSLTFVTNLGRFGPYGVEEGMPFELPAISGQIIGFHARYGRGGFLDALGVYIKASTQVVTKVGPVTQVVTKVGPVGGVTGAVIRDMNINGITRIVKISVRHASVIDALTVRFLRDGREESTEEWGGQGGKLSEFNLQAAEYITSVKGHIGIYNNYTVLKSLTFVTNLGRFGPYGVEEGMPFELPAISGQIIGFHARYGRGGFLDALGVYIKAAKVAVGTLAGKPGTWTQGDSSDFWDRPAKHPKEDRFKS